jgi:hypothetical protein
MTQNVIPTGTLKIIPTLDLPADDKVVEGQFFAAA